MTNEAPAQPATSSPMPIANQTMLYPGEDFTLSAGDLISVAVFMQPDYAATVRLRLDGTAELAARSGPRSTTIGSATPGRTIFTV